ncbi:hypothetical protein ES705_21335 [subsurface metagenome]
MAKGESLKERHKRMAKLLYPNREEETERHIRNMARYANTCNQAFENGLPNHGKNTTYSAKELLDAPEVPEKIVREVLSNVMLEVKELLKERGVDCGDYTGRREL